jgi:hypothetical protein
MTTGVVCDCGRYLAPAGQQCRTCRHEYTPDPLVRAWLELSLAASPDIPLISLDRRADREAGS